MRTRAAADAAATAAANCEHILMRTRRGRICHHGTHAPHRVRDVCVCVCLCVVRKSYEFHAYGVIAIYSSCVCECVCTRTTVTHKRERIAAIRRSDPTDQSP